MNLKHLIIFVIAVLIVLVCYLIINKRDEFYFQTPIDCRKLNLYGCGLHSDSCLTKEKDSGDVCEYKCKFDPVNVDLTNYGDHVMVTEPVQGDEPPQYYFENEEENGIFNACLNTCNSLHKGLERKGETGYWATSTCDSNDCQLRCHQYLSDRIDRIGSADIKYMPYPTNRLEQVNYNELKDTIITEMVGDFKRDIRNTIYQDSINTEITNQVDIQEETTKLNNILTVLKNLNSTGNNFIQQVDQLGEFQDKYSQKIEELLEEKRNTDTGLDRKIDSLQNKLEELNQYYNLFNSRINTNTTNALNHVYKSVKCLANGISLNIVPVYYIKDDGSFVNYRNGVYCITLKQTPGDEGYLYVEPKKPNQSDPSILEYCNPYETGCSYKLSIQPPTRANSSGTPDAENILEIDLRSGDNILNPRYPNRDDRPSPRQYQFKKQGYFHVREIKSNDDYNSILISTPAGTRNLIKNEQIKYPFFVIESLEMPGYLVNVTKNSSANGFVLNLNPANKGGTEKFSVSNIIHSDSTNCTT